MFSQTIGPRIALGLLLTVVVEASVAATITITANTNWSTIKTGTGTGGQPGTGDTIIVKNGATLTVNVTNGQVGAITLGGGTPNGGQGTLAFSAATSQLTVVGNVTLGFAGPPARSGNLNMANGGTLTLAGFTSVAIATFAPGTGTIVLTGNNTLPSSGVYGTFNNLTVASGTTTMAINLVISGNLIVAGSLNTATRTLTVNGNMTLSGTATITNAITVSGATSIAGTCNITSAIGDRTFVGDVILNGAWNHTAAGNSNVFFQGNLTNNGTLDAGNATYTFNGAAVQTLTGTSAGTTFVNATLNNANGLLLAGTHNLTVSTLLTLSAGKITTGANTVYVSNGSAIAGATTGRFIEGNLKKRFSAGNPNGSFEVGGNGGTNYSPVTLTFASVTTPGDITVSTSAGVHPQIATSGLDDATPALLNRYWTLTNSSVGFTSYSATFTYVATEIDAAASAAAFVAVRYDGASWNPTTLSGTPTTTSLTITGETGFGAFALGNTSAPSGTLGRFNAYDPPPLTPTGSVTGNIRTKIAGTLFTLTIVHLNVQGTAVSNLNDNIAVDLLDGSPTGGTFTNNCSSSWTTVIASVAGNISGGNYSTTVSFNVGESYPNVRVRVTRAGGSEIGCSNDNFAIRPANLVIEALDSDWRSAGTTRPLNNTGASGGAVHAASIPNSTPFTLRVTARNSASATTTNYAGTPTKKTGSPACVLPAGCTNGDLQIGTWSPSSGVLTASAYYSEAGTFTLALEDSSFAAVDAADTDIATRTVPAAAAPEIGRFVPDHFVFSGANVPVLQTFGASCTSRSFTYVGQPFWFTVPPSATVSAVNSGGAVTANYQGSLFKLTGAGVAETYSESTAGRPALTCKLASDLSTACGPTNAAAPTIAALTGVDVGKGTYTAASTGAALMYSRSTTAPTAPYNATISSTVTATDSSENGVTGNPGNGATAALTTPTPFVFDNGGIGILFDGNDFDLGAGLTGGKTFVYGRLRMDNAFGSPNMALPIGLRTQYWNGSAFLTNSQDQCTTLSRTNITLSDYRVNLSACETAVVQDTVTFTNGSGQLYLAAPGVSALTGGPAGTPAVGSVLVTPNLGASASGNYCPSVGGAETPTVAANKSYLQGAWTGATYTENASARGTFGLYGAQPKNFIFFRENY